MRCDKIVLLSGPICSGKSTLAKTLAEKFALKYFKSTELIKEIMPIESCGRGSLQCIGKSLDATFGSWWLSNGVAQKYPECDTGIVVDCVRTKEQLSVFREKYQRQVVHVHLYAPYEELQSRWAQKAQYSDGDFKCYDDTQRDSIEKQITELRETADISINTSRCTSSDVLERVSCLLGLYGRSRERLVDVLIGGQYGSEGKGNIAAYLSPEYDYLVRVGGPNAGHKVKTSALKEYTFHQLPSGTAHSKAKLVIGPGAVVSPKILLNEISQNDILPGRLFIDPQAMIIDENDILGEKGLVDDIASTGSGSGYAAARRIMYRGKPDKIKLARDISEFKPYIRESLEVFEDAFRKNKRIFLEGTQGTGLSLYHGYYPHVTSRDTTVSGCLAEAGLSSVRVRKVIMVCRTYPIRVANSDAGGDSGPMSREVTRQELSQRSGVPLNDLKELTSTTLRPRRIGEFDWTLLRKSAALNAPTDIALTFADYLDSSNKNARRFEQLTEETIHFIEEIERFTSAPVSLISTRFHHERGIIDRRTW